ncbi:MAG: hypothetical protein WD877_01470 [Candidatus Saccharimonadales bacterium]
MVKSKREAAGGRGRSRKLSRKQERTKAKAGARSRSSLPSSFWLVKQSFAIWRQHWRPLFGIMAVYLILNFLLAGGISRLNTAVNDIKINLSDSASHASALSEVLAGFGVLTGNSGSAAGSTLQSVFIILTSLVVIWALRHLLAGQAVSIKQSFYSAMAPLIPFLLVILVIFLQLLPLSLGAAAFGAVLANSLVVDGLVLAVIGGLFAAGASWSIYMVSSSIFALYIVTLPNRQPRESLRLAKELVRYRRWEVVRKLLFLPLFVWASMILLIVPLILTVPLTVPPVFYALSALAILFTHTYLYSLYRRLIE